jgi:hypothetical protein
MLLGIGRLSKKIAYGFLFSLMATMPSEAASTLQDLDLKSLCPAPSTGTTVSKYLLARALMSLYQVPIDLVDWNDSGVTYDDYAASVTVYQCAPETFKNLTKTQQDKCKATQSDNQLNAVLNFADELQKAAGSSDGDFDVKLKKGLLHFHRIRSLSPIDQKRQPIFALGSASLAAQVLSRDPEFFQVTCAGNVAPPSLPGSTAPGNVPAPTRPVLPTPSGSPPATAPIATQPSPPGASWPPSGTTESFLDHWRIRVKPEDLAVGRDTDDFKGLAPASLALANDQIAKKDTFDIHTVLGYALPSLQLEGGTVLTPIPFIRYDRDYVATAKPPANSNVNNVSVGIQGDLLFPMLPTVYSELIFQPQYVQGLDAGFQIVKFHTSLQPEPLMPALGYPLDLGVLDLKATAYVRGVLNIGSVLASGGSRAFLTTNNFMLAGPQLGASFFDDLDGSLLNGVSIPIDYTYLHSFSGGLGGIRLLDIAANYALPKTKYVSIGFSYTNGKNLDSYQIQNIYKLTLGIKY